MSKEKIAVVVDSGSDISNHLKGDLDIYRLPLGIIVNEKTYTDGLDITREEVFKALETEKVTTSLPNGEIIEAEFSKLKDMGYTHIIAVVISSGLSGTCNIIRLLSENIHGLTVHVVDTLNISLGSGLIGLEVAKLVKEGKSFDEIVKFSESAVSKSKVFFTVGTLDYLIRGGRIGLVAGSLANVLNIKPVISCNEEGIYHTIAKTRGYRNSIRKMIDAAAEFVASIKEYRVVLLNANSQENIERIVGIIKESMPHARSVETTDISPALAIHTGPEALGIAVYRY